MKKFIIGSLLLFSSIEATALNIPHEVILNQRNAANTSYVIRYLNVPTEDSVMIFNNTTKLPEFVGFNTGLQMNSGKITLQNVPFSAMNMTGKPWVVDFVDNGQLPSHTHDAADIVVQTNNWAMCRVIPAGRYVRIRSGAISGTASVSLNATQQETLL